MPPTRARALPEYCLLIRAEPACGVRLHRTGFLSKVHCLDDFRMVGLAGIAETLGKIVWANAVEVDARHGENGVEVVEPPARLGSIARAMVDGSGRNWL